VTAGGKATLEASSAADPKEVKRDVKDFKPGPAVFANFHPALSASVAAAYAATTTGAARMDIVILDGAVALKVDVAQRAAKTIEVAGKRSVAQVYQLRFPNVDMDLYVTEDGRTVAWNVPAQMIKAVAPGWEDLIVDPTTKMPELSQPTMKATTEKGVKVRMRDGVELVCDMARPAEEGRYPVILVRTPYGRPSYMANADWWARRGYVFMVEDVRGRGDSGGEWEPFVHERADGFDTIDWISKQPWCNGSVGMIGGSYVGWVQWWAAVERPPALKCIVPQVSPPGPFYNFPIDHGIPFLYGWVWWAAVVKDKGPLTELPKLAKLEGFKELPLTKVEDAVVGHNVPFIDRWWDAATPSAFGAIDHMPDMHKVTIPALHISGWWDGDGIGTRMNWAAMRALKRTNQWLIYGPWHHAFNTSSRLGDTDYGPDAIIELDSVYLRWFDAWLKGKQVGLERMPRVRVFVTGANKWVDLTDWPDPRSVESALYLSSSGPANGPDSVGVLSDARPLSNQDPDRYTYNPARAEVPKDLGSMDVGEASTVVKLEPKDQDTLVYKTAPLDAPVVMTGPVDVDLYISSTAVDTDFYASVVDVDEKGVMRAIGRAGKLRARYHRSFEKPELLKPGRVYKLTLAHWDVAHQFAKGHRIGLVITSDGFPIYARNLGTGEPNSTGTRMVAQSNTVYHDAKRPSALRFRALTMP